MSKKTPKKQKSGLLGRIVRRFFLLLFTIVILLVAGLALIMNLVFNGPSPAARDVLTMSLLEPSATKWIPGLFMDQEIVEQIRNAGKDEQTQEEVNLADIVIMDAASMAASDEWAAYPDGIRIERYSGKTFNAHIMLIQDPSRVYMGLSSYGGYSADKPGKRLGRAVEDEGAAAAVNGGAFNDDGTLGGSVGSIPAGIVVHEGKVVSNTLRGMIPQKGFCGFNSDYKLVVAETITEQQVYEQNIQEGCEFGPVLIVNGVPNQAAYSSNSGYNPRTVIGQRADGVVLFVCADGRQAGSVGATFKDMIDILMEYGAVNACAMDGGSSSTMYYRNPSTGEVELVNNPCVLQNESRKMPNYWMVKPLQ